MELLFITLAIIAVLTVISVKKRFGRGGRSKSDVPTGPFGRLVIANNDFDEQGLRSSEEFQRAIIDVVNTFSTGKEDDSGSLLNVFAAAALYDERNSSRNGVRVVDILETNVIGNMKRKVGANSQTIEDAENICVIVVGMVKYRYRMSIAIYGRLQTSDADFLDEVVQQGIAYGRSTLEQTSGVHPQSGAAPDLGMARRH